MNDHVERLLHCIPQKVIARFREPAYGLLEKQERSVAVVFIDIEACTRLCEDLPPKEMNQLIEARFSCFFDSVERAGGFVNEIMGDGFMAIFDETDIRDNARAAVSAALAIQKQNCELNVQRTAQLDPILVNIGIDAGIGFVGVSKFQTSSGERWTYSALGSVTNIAARLCALATGGSILISGNVAGHVRGVIHALEPLGAQNLKNVSQPVPAFRLSAAVAGAQ